MRGPGEAKGRKKDGVKFKTSPFSRSKAAPVGGDRGGGLGQGEAESRGGKEGKEEGRVGGEGGVWDEGGRGRRNSDGGLKGQSDGGAQGRREGGVGVEGRRDRVKEGERGGGAQSLATPQRTRLTTIYIQCNSQVHRETGRRRRRASVTEQCQREHIREKERQDK